MHAHVVVENNIHPMGLSTLNESISKYFYRPHDERCCLRVVAHDYWAAQSSLHMQRPTLDLSMFPVQAQQHPTKQSPI